MKEKKLKFLVVFFSRNRRLLITIAVLAAIVAAVWLIVSVTNWLVDGRTEETVPWTVIYNLADWRGETSNETLPRFFVAGGITYDQQILVKGWGMSEEVLTPVDYMEDLGIHLLYGDVLKITYDQRRLEVFIAEKEAGYQLITVSKARLEEGDLQIVYCDAKGVPLGYEEEFVYSVPLKYSIVKTGENPGKSAAVFMEVMDSETLPALTGMESIALSQYPSSVLLYIQGGEAATIQRNENTVRIYVDPAPVYQVVAVDTAQFRRGQNMLRLIDSSDLSVKTQIIFMAPQD